MRKPVKTVLKLDKICCKIIIDGDMHMALIDKRDW